MEHIFEEYGNSVENKYVFIVCKEPQSTQKAINLCKEKLDEGFYVLSNELISHHPRFILINNTSTKPYYIYRIYTL